MQTTFDWTQEKKYIKFEELLKCNKENIFILSYKDMECYITTT